MTRLTRKVWKDISSYKNEWLAGGTDKVELPETHIRTHKHTAMLRNRLDLKRKKKKNNATVTSHTERKELGFSTTTSATCTNANCVGFF